MEYRYLFFFLLLVSFLPSCINTNSTTNISDTDTLQYTSIGHTKIQPSQKKLSFPLDEKTGTFSEAMFTFIDEKNRYLVFVNHNTNELLFFNIDNQNLEFRIEIKEEGTEAVGRIAGFAIKTLDSIFITPAYTPKLYMINSKGKVQDIINYQFSGKEENEYTHATSVWYSPIIFYKNDLYLSQSKTGYIPNYTRQELETCKISLCINLSDKTIKSFPLTYPSDLSQNQEAAYHLRYSRTFDGENNFVYAFNYSHNVYVTDSNYKEWKKYVAKSVFFDNEGGVPDTDLGKLQRWYLENGWYKNIIYDPYREVYYRFAYPGVEVSNQDNIPQMIYYKPLFSVIILDKEFNVIGETLMPRDTYFMEMFFVLEEGLFISTNHINNPNLNEDILEFQCFELTKNED